MRGIIDKNIETTELVHRAPDDRLTVVRIADITGHERDLAPLFLDQRLHVLRVLVFVQVSDEKIGAFAGKGDGNRPANPTIAACNDRSQAPQPARAPVTALTMVWSWLHFCRRTCHGLLLRGKRWCGIG